MGLLILLLSLPAVIMALPAQKWQDDSNIPTIVRPLPDNTIFFQALGQTIDTVGTLHAHLTLNVSRPLSHLDHVENTAEGGISYIHNQLVAFLTYVHSHLHRRPPPGWGLHPTEQQQALDRLRLLLEEQLYDNITSDVSLYTIFTSETFKLQPNAGNDLTPPEFLRRLLRNTSMSNTRWTRSYPACIRELQQWRQLLSEIATQRQHLQPFSSTTSRQKRFIPLLMAGAAVVASTFLGVWNTIELRNLKDTTNDLVIRVDGIITQQQADQQHLRLIDDVLAGLHHDVTQLYLDNTGQQLITMTRRQFLMISQEVVQITQVIDGLMTQHLSSSLIDQNLIQSLFHNISTQATTLQYDILPIDALQLLQCPTSFLSENNLIHIFIHVPIAQAAASRLRIYRHIPLPFQINQQPAIIVKSDLQYLAINTHTRSFFTLTEMQFRSCQHVGSLSICPNNIIYLDPNIRHDTNTSMPQDAACLYALFTQNWHTARDVCDVFPAPRHPIHMYQLQADQVLINTFTPIQALITCPSHSHTDIHISRPSIVTIPPTCTIHTPYSHFTATLDLYQSFTHKDYPWPHDPISFLQPLQSTAAWHSLIDTLPSLHPSTNLRLWTQNHDIISNLHWWTSANTILPIICIIISSIITYFLIKQYVNALIISMLKTKTMEPKTVCSTAAPPLYSCDF